MQAEEKERWLHLCALAAEEQDPVRLGKLVHEICQLLEAKQLRLKVKPPEPPQKRHAGNPVRNGIQNRPPQAEKEA